MKIRDYGMQRGKEQVGALTDAGPIERALS